MHLDDEVLDLEAIDETERATLQGEGALMAAVRAPRTGRMGDIVATIQAEQDRIVRDELAGVLVVQGGPGTGKTAVALHRAAYLLFTYRQRLERSGVLVVGPGPLFLRYIEQVLPVAGRVRRRDGHARLAVPGRRGELGRRRRGQHRSRATCGWCEVLANAVRDRQRLPDDDLELAVGSHRITLTRSAVAAARAAGRGSTARRTTRPGSRFVKDMLRHLAGQLAQQMGQTLSDELRQELDADLRDSRDVRVNLNLLWMPLTPQRFLQDLFATPVRLASAATRSAQPSGALLERDRDQPFTLSDVPLLDEVAELIGEDGEAGRAAGAAAVPGARRRARVRQGRAGHDRPGRPAGARDRRRDAGGPVRRDGPGAERGRARRGRPVLGLRAPGGRRGAGAHAR